MAPTTDFRLMVDGLCQARLVLAATVFFDAPPQEHGGTIIEAWNSFRSWCPAQALRFFTTETMSRHEALRPDSLDMVQTWFAPQVPRRSVLVLEFKGGSSYDEVADWSFLVSGMEPADPPTASMLQITVPADLGPAGHERLKAYTAAAVARLGASHALAGYAMAVSAYHAEAGQTFAWARSMRHRGVDILLPNLDDQMVGGGGVKGANWLTYLDAARLQRLGSADAVRAALDPGVGVTPIAGGLLLQAGDVPQLGDENRRERLPLYRSVFAALEPLTAEAFDEAEMQLEDWDEAEALTLRWLKRLAS